MYIKKEGDMRKSLTDRQRSMLEGLIELPKEFRCDNQEGAEIKYFVLESLDERILNGLFEKGWLKDTGHGIKIVSETEGEYGKYKVYWNPRTLGISSYTLDALKQTIVNWGRDRVEVHEVVPSNEELAGFFIVNHSQKKIVYTGDGLRTDSRGEGGRAYKNAWLFLESLGFSQFECGRCPVYLDFKPEDDIERNTLELNSYIANKIHEFANKFLTTDEKSVEPIVDNDFLDSFTVA